MSLNSGMIDEDEARERLSQLEWWGELAPGFEPPSDPMEMAKLEMLRAAPQDGNGNGLNGNGNGR